MIAPWSILKLGSADVTLAAGPSGHFVADGSINGVALRFMVDTGATYIALPGPQADALGIDVDATTDSHLVCALLAWRARPGYAVAEEVVEEPPRERTPAGDLPPLQPPIPPAYDLDLPPPA